LISKFNPSIIFEFHPLIYSKTGNSFTQPFHELIAHGYRKFIFFDKFGVFSHLQINISDDEIDFLSQICLNGNINDDWHYDVIALNDNSKIDPVQLAESTYSKTH
jgi:hypothetical protein